MKRWFIRGGAKLRGKLSGANYLSRLVWLGCISVTLPIMLLGIAYLHISTNKLKAQFQEDSLTSLQQLKDRMEATWTNIEFQSLQLTLNPLVRSAIGQPDFTEQYVEQGNLLDLLSVQKNASSFIDEIVLYDAASNLVLSNSYGSVMLQNSPHREDISHAITMDNRAGWFYLPGAAPGMLAYVRQLPVMSIGKPQAALIFYMKSSDMSAILFDSTPSRRDQTWLVLDSRDRILLHSGNSRQLGKPASSDLLLNRVASADSDSDLFMMSGPKGENTITVYFKTALGRTYVSMLPEREMISQLSWARWLVAFSVLVMLLFGIALSILSSRLAYSPIDKLLQFGKGLRGVRANKPPGNAGNELDFIQSCLMYLNEQAESLDRYVSAVQPDLRDQFLLKLLSSSSAFRAADAAAQARSLQIPPADAYAVLITKVENLFKEKRFLPSEGAIIVFAVRNIMLELLQTSGDLQGYVVEKDGAAVAVLHPASGADPDRLPEAVRRYGQQVVEAMQTYLSFKGSIGVGGFRSELTGLAESYMEASLALQRRLFNDSQSVFLFEELPPQAEKTIMFNYPKKLELDLNEYLLQGELALAESTLQQFSERVRAAESYNTAMHCYHVLLSAILQSLEEQGYGVLDRLGDNLFEQLKARQTYVEVHEWLTEVVFPLHRQITDEIRGNAMKISVQRVCQHIEAHQGMPSLIECAELVRMSPSYLSRMFKQETGVSFIDYLMNYKVERAKGMLRETDRSVGEIAELVGYSERNLNRVFQKHVLMSPKQYRMSFR